MAALKHDPMWVVSIYVTNDVIGDREFAPVLAGALNEYAEALTSGRLLEKNQTFVSAGGTKITAMIEAYDAERIPPQSGSQTQPG